MSETDNEKELFQIIRRRSFREGTFQLSSGGTSTRYFNLKTTMMWPRGAYLSARALLARTRALNPDYIGGLEMGAVPIIAAMAALSDTDHTPIKTFFVRKEPKGHGTRDLIEGLATDESLARTHVLIVDDVATTGTSILKAARVAREAGATVTYGLVLIDREEGAAEAMQREDMALATVFHASEFDTIRQG